MDRVQLEKLPLETIVSDNIQYFWLHLPYAIPGFLTFFLGLFICFFCLRAFFQKSKNYDYLSFASFFFTFSILSFILSLRAVIQSKEAILEIQYYTYWVVFFTVPSLTELFYIATHKRFKIFRIINSILILYGLYCVYLTITNQAFSGEWFQFPFGLYPVTTLPIKIWGAICLILFLIICIPGIIIHFYKPLDKDPNKLIIIGGILISLLISSNVPSMSGIEIYPLGLFNFVPMVIIGYAIFKSNFFDLRTLIFDKKFGFYILASLITLLLVIIVLLISSFYKPEFYDRELYNPFLLIPLVSLFFILLLATYLSGSNPSNKLNLHVSGVILCYGILQILGVFRGIDFEPLVSLRIEQLLYLFFVTLPVLNIRLLFMVMGTKNDWRVLLITILTVIYMILSQTPYFFDGFYNYSFGRMPKSGIGMKLFISTSIFSLVFVIIEWRKLQNKQKDKTKSIFFYTFIFSNLLIVLNIPSVSGIAFYPLGNFQIITALLFSYLVIKNNIVQTEGKASKISTRYSIFIFIMTIIIVLIYWTTLNNSKGYTQNILHCLVITVNLFLANYILSFLISRPIANYMDENYENLVLSTLELESIKHKKEASNKEIGKISELQLKINSYTEIYPMIMEISSYLEETFNIDSSWLFLINKNTENLETAGVVLSKAEINQESLLNWAKKLLIPLKPDSGSLYFCYSRKKPYYYKNVKISRRISDIDKEIIEMLNCTSVAHFPIEINNECIGIFAIVMKNNQILKQEEINRINGFVSLVSGSIQRINLIQEAVLNKQKSWELAEEIASINDLNRIITENDNIDHTMNSVTNYLNNKLDTNLYYSLYKVDESKQKAYYYSHSLPYELSHEDFMKLKKNSIDLIKGKSFHSLVYLKRKLIYFKEVKKVENAFENWVCQLMNIKSYISIPLISNDSIIGLLNLTNANGKKLKLNKNKLRVIEDMSKQISSAMDKSLRYQNFLESKNRTETILKRLKMLNELSLDFNADLNLDNIFNKLESFLQENFNIHQFGLILVNTNKKEATIHSTNIINILSQGKRKILDEILINLDEPKSAHSLVFNNKKDFLIKKISDQKISKSELILRKEFNINSIYIIPLIIRDDVIGFLDIFDKDTIELSKQERIDIVEFSSLISSALWNSILVANITKTYEEYKASQNQLIQSEKMASLGQLISGVAHEINTPLGAIKASIGNINQSIEEIIIELPELLDKLDKNVWNQVNELINSSKETKILNTKEQRIAKKELFNYLESHGVEDADFIADSLVDIGILKIKEEHIDLWKHEQKKEILNTLYNISGFNHKVDIIEDSITRASKIVYALKNYAHFSESEEKQLASIEESIDTVLTIYQNSFKKGVDIIKEYDSIEPIYCFPDELNQVWTNLIHNALQAMNFKGTISIKINKESVSKRKNIEIFDPIEFDEDVVIQIIDDGPGIPEDVKEKIFNAFFTTKKRGEGSGLGLHITKKILNKHNAEIDLESKPGKTNFIIRIPYITSIPNKLEAVE